MSEKSFVLDATIKFIIYKISTFGEIVTFPSLTTEEVEALYKRLVETKYDKDF